LIHLKKDKIGAAGCGYDIPENARWIEKAWFFFRKLETHRVRHLPGGNLIVKRSLFKKIGGFNEDLITGEDSEFCNRLKEIGFTIAQHR
jgi:GT2 family glycosyltransferase